MVSALRRPGKQNPKKQKRRPHASEEAGEEEVKIEEKDISRILVAGMIIGLIMIAVATYLAEGIAAGCLVLGLEMLVGCLLVYGWNEDKKKPPPSPPPERVYGDHY
jgi:hypothetical protein